MRNEFDIRFATSIVDRTSLKDSSDIPKTLWEENQSYGHCLTTSDDLEEYRTTYRKENEAAKKLQLRCVLSSINVVPQTADKNDAETQQPMFIPSFDLSDNIFKVVTSTEPDVEISTDDGVNIRAHKSILSDKSEVFRALFATEMEEADSNSVDIIDFTGPVMQELLRFIYFGNVHNIEDVNVELYKAADVYDIELLREICLKSISDGVSRDNVTELVKFANQYSLDDLFSKCCDKILR